MVPLSGRVPPAGVHEDPAKTVTSMEAARVLEVIKKETSDTENRFICPDGCGLQNTSPDSEWKMRMKKKDIKQKKR